MYPASNASDDQPRTRTARACDSCYKRKVSFVLDQFSILSAKLVPRLNVMLPFRSVIGAVTIIFPAHSTEWCRGKEKTSTMRGEPVPRPGSFVCLTLKIKTPQSFTAIGAN